MRTFRQFLPAFFFLLLFAGCGKKNVESNNTYEIAQLKKSFLASFELAATRHQDAFGVLRQAGVSFTQIPTFLKFNDFKSKWITARHHFQTLQLYQRMQGGIANPMDYVESEVETPLMDPSYIDYVSGDPVGIITDPANYPNIQGTTVTTWHEATGSNKTLGFQVVEFLLWGEDNNPNGSGARTSVDYDVGDPIGDRRRAFLSFTMFFLDLEVNKNFYTESFEEDVLAADNESFLIFLLNGVIAYIEDDVVARALNKPFISQDPNDELDVFSDNSLNEIGQMLEALDLVLIGREYFSEHNSMFLLDFIRFVAPETATSIEANLSDAHETIASINGSFDNAISNPSERSKIQQAMDQLNTVASDLRSFGLDYGLKLQ